MKNEKIFVTGSAEETEKMAGEFAKNLKPGSILLLYGDLGGGKTTFVRGLVQSLGFSNRVVSPTFTISRTYSKKISDVRSRISDGHKDIKTIYHLDLYRLQSGQDLKSLDFEEMFSDPSAVTIIEWPERVENLVQYRENVIRIKCESIDVEKRRIVIGVEN